MEFLKSFAEARKQGLTKEEFLQIWENESKAKLLTEEAKVLQLRQSSQEIGLGASNIQYPSKESKLEFLILQQTEQVQKLIHEVNQLQRQQIQQQAEVKDEVKKLSETLSNQVETLNRWLTKTHDERLGTPLEIQTLVGKKNLSSSGTSYEVMGQTSLEELAHVKDTSHDSELHLQHFHRQREQEIVEDGFEMSSSETNCAPQDDWKLVGLKGKYKKYNEGNTEASAAVNVKIPDVEVCADSVFDMMSLDESIQGQIYGNNMAEVNRMKQAPQYRSKEAKRRNKDIPPLDLSINYFPDSGAEFFVLNIRMFQASNQDFFTESLYTRPKACKVRIRLWFNRRGRLGVHLLVSEGIFDERHNWPLVFNGNGYIFNQSSGSYTKIWTIESQKCSMPMKNKAETLGASVCLSTSRDPHPDVTYELLMKKRYIADGDRLLFRWDLTSTEKRDDYQDSCEYAYAAGTF